MASRQQPGARSQAAEHALLGLLVMAGGAAHGYDLTRQFQRGRPLGEVIRLESAMLYKHLKKLARLGWITMTLEDQAPRPPRQVCQLTAAGEAELRRWLAEPVGHTRDVRLEFLVKLYFARHLDPALANRLARDQHAVMRQLAGSLSQQLAHVDAESARLPEEDGAFRRLVLSLRLSQTEAAAAWLEGIAASSGSRPR